MATFEKLLNIPLLDSFQKTNWWKINSTVFVPMYKR